MIGKRSLVVVAFVVPLIASCARHAVLYKPEDLTTQKVLEVGGVFKDLYSKVSQDTIPVKGETVEISFYNVNTEELLYRFRDLPGAVAVIKVKGRGETRVPLQWPFAKREYVVPKRTEPMVCIQDGSGGNAWNANPMQVILLSREHFLKHVGEITHVRDVDGDGEDDLITIDDIWEIVPWLSHAGAPGVVIFWRAENGTLVRDTKNHTQYYAQELKRIADAIKGFSTEAPTKNNEELLSLILEQFLVYRALGRIDDGWRTFEESIRHYGDQYFLLYRWRPEPERIPVVDIEREMRKTLAEER